ncbi:MAG: MBL fold metallo-hydrolase [Clostridia bacterium]|nr:MBL fold metallo-hydrolase [Clostridia bacterium]
MSFTAFSPFPGVWHIADAMGVHMTLLEDEDSALLYDCGYGLEDVRAFVSTLTHKPLTVILSHMHHDHALGAMWFERVYLHESDIPFTDTYTGEYQRTRVLAQAETRGISGIAQDYSSRPMASILPLSEIPDLPSAFQLIHLPGHTPGTVCLLDTRHRLLLTSDNWNPTTWVFFPEAMGLETYMNSFQSLLKLPFDHVLAPHSGRVHTRDELERFHAGITREKVLSSERTSLGDPYHVDTRHLVPYDGTELCFDFEKARSFLSGDDLT